MAELGEPAAWSKTELQAALSSARARAAAAEAGKAEAESRAAAAEAGKTEAESRATAAEACKTEAEFRAAAANASTAKAESRATAAESAKKTAVLCVHKRCACCYGLRVFADANLYCNLAAVCAARVRGPPCVLSASVACNCWSRFCACA